MMGYETWIVLILVVLIAAVVSITHIARRIGRLNTLLIKSRRSLEYALRARANAARDFASCGVLDMAASLLLAESADECLRESNVPLVDDGLDSVGGSVDSEASLRRVGCESALSRTLRLTVDELPGCESHGVVSALNHDIGDVREQKDNDMDTLTDLDLAQEQKRLFSQLQRARFDVKMTRSFHNSHVDQVRRLRRGALARLFHLAGRAPMPHTVDIDDE